jgi:hypothetical protein
MAAHTNSASLADFRFSDLLVCPASADSLARSLRPLLERARLVRCGNCCCSRCCCGCAAAAWLFSLLVFIFFYNLKTNLGQCFFNQFYDVAKVTIIHRKI